MARDEGPERAEEEEVDELRREAALRREAVKRTAAALEDRLRERSVQVGEVFDRTRDRLHRVDDTVTKYRYLFVGGAVGVGLALARPAVRRPRSRTGSRAASATSWSSARAAARASCARWPGAWPRWRCAREWTGSPARWTARATTTTTMRRSCRPAVGGAEAERGYVR